MEYKIIDVTRVEKIPSWGNQKKYIAVHYLGVDGENNDLDNTGCGAHYYIYWDGRIYQRCIHDAIPWAVGTGGYYTQKHSNANNANTISIEMCCHNSVGSDSAEDKHWYFTNETQESCVWLVKKLMGDLGIPLNNVLRHYDIVNKVCPNPYVYNNKYKTSWTWDEFKAALSGTTVAPKEDIWLAWTKYESGSAGFRQTGGDSGKAYGKYQFDYRYGLVPFMQSCVAYNASRYAGFKPFIALGAGNARLPGNKDLTAIWGKYCVQYPEEFENLQDKAAMTDYYYPVKSYLLKNGINLDNHDSAVRGSAFSMAIRSGALTAANKFSGCKDSDADNVILKKIYATYGQEDAGRWPRQLAEALAAIKVVTPAPDKPEQPADTYIVQAGSYKDKKLANSLEEVLRQRGFNTLIKQESGEYKIQCGSFSNKANADKLLACIRQCGFDAVIKSPEFVPYKIRVDAVDLRVRSGAGIKYTRQAFTGKGEFTIVDEKKDASGQVWGLLKAYERERNGWVALWLDCVDRV